MKNAAPISTVAFVVLAASAIALAERGALVAHGAAGIAAQVAGVALMIWARITFGRRSFHFAANPTKGGLVTNGPYRYVRNPIYSAALLVIGAAVATSWSLVNGVLGAVIVAGMIVRILCEERLLAAEYPEYAEYRARTRRLIPYVL